MVLALPATFPALQTNSANSERVTYTYDTSGRVLSVKAPGYTGSTQYAYTTSGCSSCGGVANKISYLILPEGDRIAESGIPANSGDSIFTRQGKSGGQGEGHILLYRGKGVRVYGKRSRCGNRTWLGWSLHCSKTWRGVDKIDPSIKEKVGAGR